MTIQRACDKIARHWPFLRTIIARVRQDNPRAIAAFRKAGFDIKRTGHGAIVLAFRLPALVPHNRLTCGRAEANAVAAVARSGRWVCGEKVAELEYALAHCAGVSSTVCVGSGLAALRLALIALGVGKGDEVIVPAYSCVALPNAVLSLQSRPVPVDVLPGSWNIDPVEARRKLSRRTKAVIAVHTFGVPALVNELKKLGVPVIEDCAHAFGTSPCGRALGSRGDIAITSLYATKLIGAGEGGAVLTNNADVAARVRRWRDYSDQPACGTRLNDKMTDFEAALGLCQLRRLPELLRRRAAHAQRYLQALRCLSNGKRGLVLPEPSDERVWYRFVVRAPSIAASRVCGELAQHRVGAAEPIWDWRKDNRRGQPVASLAFRELVSLPLYPTLTRAEQARVIKVVGGFLAGEEQT